ncbi:sugar kinase (plasmid) [Streptomyces sp. BI20]|uniref:sugar kinase n=1 Tax=Streptomyces sp. BI20 TaxID=3403460 RepID=UPI003C75B799
MTAPPRPPALVTLGEALATLTPTGIGPLRTARTLELGLAGAETTVAIGVRRLGHPTAWIGRLGADELGAHLRRTLKAEDVALPGPEDHEAPTAVMFKERRTAGARRVHYLRRDSAGSRLTPADLPDGLVERARVLHTSAITTALSPSAADTVRTAVARARRAGVTVSFDANHRASLWTREAARTAVLPLLAHVDLLFAGLDEAHLLLGHDSEGAGTHDTPEGLARALHGLGPATVVLTRGRAGAVSVGPDGTHRQPALSVPEVDPVGAGDSFVAGYLAALLDGTDAPGRLALGARVAAFSVSAHGDWEGLPDRSELTLPLDAPGTVLR